MDKFIALKPVRFDKDYIIGAEIDAGVIAPGNIKRLIESGRIAPAVTANTTSATAHEAAFLYELVEFLEKSLEVAYEDGELEDLTVYDRAELCKEGLTSIMELIQMEAISVIDGVLVSGDDNENADIFPCPQCDKVFNTQAGLNSHMRIHR